MVNHFNVKFNLTRWIIFLSFSAFIGFLFKFLFEIKYISTGIGSGISALIIYYLFYLQDKKLANRKKKLTYVKESKNIILNFYLVLVYLLSVISVLDIVSYFFTAKSFLEFQIPIKISLFLFSLFCLYYFYRKNYSKLTFILPTWLILEFFFAIYLFVVSINFPATINRYANEITVLNALLEILKMLVSIWLIAKLGMTRLKIDFNDK